MRRSAATEAGYTKAPARLERRNKFSNWIRAASRDAARGVFDEGHDGKGFSEHEADASTESDDPNALEAEAGATLPASVVASDCGDAYKQLVTKMEQSIKVEGGQCNSLGLTRQKTIKAINDW